MGRHSLSLAPDFDAGTLGVSSLLGTDVGAMAVLTATPYGLVPALAFAFITPTLLLWGISAQNGLTGRLSDGEYALGVLVACGLSLIGRSWDHVRNVVGHLSQD